MLSKFFHLRMSFSENRDHPGSSPGRLPGRCVAFDLGEIGDRAGGFADFVEQLQPVLAYLRIVGVDRDLVEEGVDDGRNVAIAGIAARNPRAPTAACRLALRLGDRLGELALLRC